MKCPNCGNKRIRESMRTRGEKSVPFFRPYRCEDCRYRFWWVKSKIRDKLIPEESK